MISFKNDISSSLCIYILDLMHIKFHTEITFEEKSNSNKSTLLNFYPITKTCFYISI